MKYEPKTTAEQRRELVQYLCNVNHRGAKVQRICDDLAACEAALADERRKNAELEQRIAKLIEAGDAMYTHGDFTRSRFSVDSDWSKLTTNLPQPPERSV